MGDYFEQKREEIGYYPALAFCYKELNDKAIILMEMATDLSARHSDLKKVLWLSIGCNVALLFIIYLISS